MLPAVALPTVQNTISPTVGQIYFDISSSQMKMFDGVNWVTIDGTNFLERDISVSCEEKELDGITWYTVEPKGGMFSSRQEWWATAESYAKNTFKDQGDAWNLNCNWIINNGKFWFKKERDRTLFVLKIS